MNDKVYIKVTEGHNYVNSVKNGMAYTSVSYSGKKYGGTSPCDNDEEVSNSIKQARKTITNEGDIPILQDERKKATLLNWG